MIYVIKHISIKLNQNISLLKHIDTKKEYGTAVEEHDFSGPKNDEINYILKDTINDCKNKYFHSSEYRCVYNIRFAIMERFEEVVLMIFIRHMKFKSQFYGLKEKIQNLLKNGFNFKKKCN